MGSIGEGGHDVIHFRYNLGRIDNRTGHELVADIFRDKLTKTLSPCTVRLGPPAQLGDKGYVTLRL